MHRENTLLILGAGGHGKSVAEAALLSGEWSSIIFADDSWPQRLEIAGYPIVTNIDMISSVNMNNLSAIPAVGNNKLRQAWFQKLKELSIPIATIIHPSAIVSESSTVGEGVCIMAGCIVGIDVKIDRGVIVNMASSIDHDCQLGEFSHLSVGVKITGDKILEPLSFLEAGSVIAH